MLDLLDGLRWAAVDHLLALGWSAAVLAYRFWRSGVVRQDNGRPFGPSLTAGRAMGAGEVGILIWAVTETGLTGARIYSGHAWLSEVLLAALMRDLLYAVMVLLAVVAMDQGGRALLVRGVPRRVRPRIFGLGAPALIAAITVVLDKGFACVLWTALVAMGLE